MAEPGDHAAAQTAVKHTAEERAAERRRKALRAALDNAGMTLTEVAQAAGLPSSSAIGNFLNGHSQSLNVATLEPLARTLRVSLNQLVGEPEVLSGIKTYIRGEVAISKWRVEYLWPKEQWIELTIPTNLREFGESYFMYVSGSEMNRVYEAGTIVEVVDLVKFIGQLRPGNRVIVLRRNEEGFIEASCREIVSDGGTYLITRSNNPRFQDRTVPIDWPIEPGHIISTPIGDTIEVRAVVVRSIHDEIQAIKPAT